MKCLNAVPLVLLLSACQPPDEPTQTAEERTSTPPVAETKTTRQDGPRFLEFERDDLATAGLGMAGLRGAPPAPADPANPTAGELRRLAVYHNYRALVDVSEAGGFGRLYGPDATDLPIAGTEYWTLGNVAGHGSHVMLLQVPDGFPGERPCLVAAPASGSRGPLGAIGSTGDWALRQGCAVVYSDKGAGPWVANLGDGLAFGITGVRDAPDQLAILEPFSERSWETPDLAFKHAHSGHNPEAAWGEMVLDSIDFALARLNDAHRPGGVTAFEGDGVLVIAASVSNGGGAVLAAAEADEAGVIDGVVASEPNVYPALDQSLAITENGDSAALDARPLYDYGTLAAVYGPCAALDERFSESPMAGNLAMLQGLLSARCDGLAELGLVAGDDTQARAASAYQAMLDHGLHPAAADAQPANTLINLWALVGGVYANAYGRFGPDDRVCGIGFRAFDAANQATDPDPAQVAQLFGTSPGVPPVAGIDIAAVSGEQVTKLIFAPSGAAGGPAYGLDQVRCLRELWTGGGDRGERVRRGVAATRLTGNLRGKPAIIVHGRSDGLVWVNHSSRPYFALNQSVEGAASGLRYLEVTNAQHFDTLLGFPGFSARFVPLHLYFERALDRMYTHLTDGAALPVSQVIRTTPRGTGDGGTPALSTEHVPPIADGDGTQVIQWRKGTLEVSR